MFKYEDMDFQSLTTSLDIENPDGPEELYAMAQFCRMGKGTQASEENYRFYLQRAADAGSEQAKQELDALDNADAASAAEPPEEARAVEGMSLPELMQAADNGNPYALLPLAKKAMSSEFHDLPKAKQWLEKAAALAPQGVYSDEDATKIYITLGRLLKKPEFDTPENRAACHRYYSLAAELGSGEAFDELSDQYEKGYGCTADPEKAKLYAARGDNRNDPAIMIFRGIAKIQSSKNLMDLVADISRIRKASDDRDILAFADLLAAAAGFFPAYAAGCLTASFGGRGLLLALAFFGFRCLVTVPCFFLLAAPAMGRAAALRGLSRGRRDAAFSACGRGCWLGFGIVGLILCLGAWIELRLSPFMLRALLERFF